MKRIYCLAATLILFSSNAYSLTAQQEKMKACNSEASGKELKGQQRKDFMKECLSSDKLTPQQEKMKTCNTDASSKSLKGQDRKNFMKECLSAN